MTTLDEYAHTLLPAIENDLIATVNLVDSQAYPELHHMLAYHLGWEIPNWKAGKSGKRFRPLLLLLSNIAAGGDWEKAVPAASAVELVHNFSLIHDDIQDNSPLRRGRPSVWKLWGIPQAINAGDAMFSLAFLSMHNLNNTLDYHISLQASKTLQAACLHLTQGQYLDISYETIGNIVQDEYWLMVKCKTAALISACCEIGALIAESERQKQKAFENFGKTLGMAFQVQDDLLGIWGEAALTGKSTESDLVSGKKSLPVLYGLAQKKHFAKRWTSGRIIESEAAEIAQILENEGAKKYAEDLVIQLTDQAINQLEETSPQEPAGNVLKNLAMQLCGRKA